MMSLRLALILCLVITGYVPILAQAPGNTGFYGNSRTNGEVCAQNGSFMSETEVNNLVTEMLDRIGAKNRYVIVACPQLENCQATLFQGRPYILYNPDFLGRDKRLSFSNSDLPKVSGQDWETLTVLAHELDHHINNHILNPLPGATQHERELEADESAGFIIYLMGGSLDQATQVFATVPEQGTYTHPGRAARVTSVRKGWENAWKKYPRTVPTSVIVDAMKTVSIGTQVWMTENLNVDRFRNGDPIPEAKTPEEWKDAGERKQPAWCHYENDPVNGKKYGKIYNWYAVNDPRGIAPIGYHIPTEEEWQKLINHLGGKEIAGIKMKSASGWLNNGNGSNISGFSGLPGGGRGSDGSFSHVGEYGSWWSSTGDDALSAWVRALYYRIGTVDWGSLGKGKGLSVRCLRD
ncbi:MAG: hypothetical protein EBZ67_05555 [Chitinophagia bacterium]|nr:hypothetical protein [Chitinophagia bacterium]